MSGSELKSYLPRSLLPRAILILIIPLIALQLVVGLVFVQRHFEGVTRQMTRSIARELAVAQQVIDTSPSAEIAQLRLSNLSEPLQIEFLIDPAPVVPGDHQFVWYDLSGQYLIDEMIDLLGPRLSVDLISAPRVAHASLETDKGTLLAAIPRTRVTVSNPHQLLVLMTITALVLAIIGIVFLRNQIQPILRLADASDAFGKGRSVGFRPEGAEEVRRAGAAFLAMRARIERAIEQRTLMLSGVSHDLRTPLTRIKLALAVHDDVPGAENISRDVDDMERMLDTFLAFAKSDQLEDPETVRLTDLIEQIVAKAERSDIHPELCTEGAEMNIELTLRVASIERAIMNLISNAGRYGTHVRLTLKTPPRAVSILVEDDGPGVPEEKRAEVMRPFTRLDSARNQDQGGGVGLGLAITQDIARSHGGVLELGSSDMGGLKATFRIPR